MKRGVQNVFLMTGVGTVLHFLVDGLCACCLYLMIDGGGMSLLLGVFMTYNVLAFLTQPLTGMLADRLHQRHILLMASVALLAMGVAIVSLSSIIFFHLSPLTSYHLPLISSILLGMGNSLFHVWGGKEVALSTGNDVCSLGIFVSTGAFGLAVGILLHAWWLLYVFLLLIALLAVVAVRMPIAAALSEYPKKSWFVWCIVLLLMGFVVFRSFLGEVFTAGVAKGGMIVLVIGGVAMLGKAGGGWIARSIGLKVFFLLALAGAVACLVLKGSVEGLWLLGLLLINGTMAITLYWINSVMPGREGLAFGLLAAALMPGYLLAQLSGEGYSVIPSLLWTLLPTIVIELSVLWLLLERRADVLWSSVVVNILTNIPLNLYVTFVSGSVLTIFVGELLVFVVEALWYWYFVGNWRQATVYSFLCNGISFLIGLLAQLVFLLF